VDAKLDCAVVEPLPHRVVHLAALDVAGQGAVAPAPDAHPAPVDGLHLVGDGADATAEEHPQRPEAHLQEHVAPRELAGRVVDGMHHRGVREGIVAHEPPGDLEAASRHGVAGRLGRQCLSVVVDVPAPARIGVAQLGGIEVQRPLAQRRQRAPGARRRRQALIEHG